MKLLISFFVFVSAFTANAANEKVTMLNNEVLELDMEGCESYEKALFRLDGNLVSAKCAPVYCNIYRVSTFGKKRVMFVDDEMTCFKNTKDAVKAGEKLVGSKCKGVMVFDNSVVQGTGCN